jgi:apolipoprotein N-acyltransferase
VRFRIAGEEWRRHALAGCGGLLLACAFPKLHVAGLAWVAPGVILLAGLGAKPGAAFRAGYFAGLAFFLTSLYWLLLIPVRYAPIVGWLTVSLVLSFYPALWLWFAWRVFPARFESAEPGWSGLLARFVETTWGQRLRWCLLVAAALVAWEMTQARLFSGFPWNLLGASQYHLLPLIQMASVTGVYGVSFIVTWFSAALLCAFVRLSREAGRRKWSAELFVPALALAVVVALGVREVAHGPPQAARTLRMALVQPAIPQEVVWDQSYEKKAARFGSLLALSEAAVTNNPTVVVWPEAALPDLLRWSTNQYNGLTVFDAVTGFARRHKVWMVIGADDAERTPGTRDEVSFYNSSFLVNPAGTLVSSYRKRRLVMFGEYVPLSEWFPFLKRLAHVQGEFTPGTDVVTFDMAGLDVQTCVLICFEDVFPHVTREHVKDDTDFMLNLTNNGWFGESAAQWQHAANAVFRAIENGLPLVRCANNGLTCWVDRRGAMSQVYFGDSSDIYQAGYKIVNVPLLPAGKWPATFYRKRGDWFGWTCAGVTAVALMATFMRRRPAI